MWPYVKTYKTARRAHGRFTLLRAARDGGAVLRDESNWRNWNGIMLNSRRLDRAVIILFRRYKIWRRSGL